MKLKLGILTRDDDVCAAIWRLLRTETQVALTAITQGDLGSARLVDVVRMERQIREEVMQ